MITRWPRASQRVIIGDKWSTWEYTGVCSLDDCYSRHTLSFVLSSVRILTPHTSDPIVIVRRLTLVSTALLFLGTLNAELGTYVCHVTRGHNNMEYRDSPGSWDAGWPCSGRECPGCCAWAWPASASGCSARRSCSRGWWCGDNLRENNNNILTLVTILSRPGTGELLYWPARWGSEVLNLEYGAWPGPVLGVGGPGGGAMLWGGAL